MKFTGTDQLRCVAYTIVLGALVISFSHAEPRTEAILLGLCAAVASLSVHVTVIRRELHRLSDARSSQSNAA